MLRWKKYAINWHFKKLLSKWESWRLIFEGLGIQKAPRCPAVNWDRQLDKTKSHISHSLTGNRWFIDPPVIYSSFPKQMAINHWQRALMMQTDLTLPILRLLSSKAQGHDDFWKTSIGMPCHVLIFMLAFIGRLSIMSTIRWVPMCQGFAQMSALCVWETNKQDTFFFTFWLRNWQDNFTKL